ncbi:MAG: alpha-L-rhamnosidase C-terminal domain-containing protein [Armatimonadota bacterium]
MALGTTDNITPYRYIPEQETSIECAFPCKVEPGQSIILDWGRKRTGWITVSGRGYFEITCASDLRIFDVFAQPYSYFDPGVCPANPHEAVELSREPGLIHPGMMALRFLSLKNTGNIPAIITFVSMKPSEFPAQPSGSFECSDEGINTGWQMGIDTVHLCTQPGEESQTPVFGPFGNGYVQWDGCRRDREIWGGDLRPASLAWYYNWEDQTPIANSLYLIMSAQHCGCSEHGLFPGSASSHQIFYEWAFWETVCLWEYILHTGDQTLMRFAAKVMPIFLDWCERKFRESPNGWILASSSWMYTVPLKDEPLPALQAAAAIGLGAMEKLFTVLNDPDCAGRSRTLHDDIVSRFHGSFWSDELKSYLFVQPKKGDIPRSDLATNAWAILGGLTPASNVMTVLDSMNRLHRTDAGSINISPILDGIFSHNGSIWPYANAYEVAARFHAGDVNGALDLFKRYTGTITEMGHNTLFEMFYKDGSLPIQKHMGDILSLCHAWAAQGSWALQRYLLGAAPIKPGWTEFSFDPRPSYLDWVRGSIVTPQGPIDIEIENGRGKVAYPGSLSIVGAGIYGSRMEFIRKQPY